MTDTELARAEATDPHLIDLDEATRLLAGAGWKRFAVIGDSIGEGVFEPLDGYRPLPWGDRVVEALKQVRPDLEYRNFGERNLLAAQVRATQLAPALEFGPDLAAVFCGGNDLLGRKFDVDAVETELARIISALRVRKCTVFTTGLFDITNSPYVEEKYKQVMSERIKLLSERTAAVSFRLGAVYIDVPAHPANTEEIYSTDGLHLNARGHAIVATEAIRLLGRVLGNDPRAAD